MLPCIDAGWKTKAQEIASYQSVHQVQHIEGHSAQQTGKQYEKIWHGIAIFLHCPSRQYQVSLQFLGSPTEAEKKKRKEKV